MIRVTLCHRQRALTKVSAQCDKLVTVKLSYNTATVDVPHHHNRFMALFLGPPG